MFYNDSCDKIVKDTNLLFGFFSLPQILFGAGQLTGCGHLPEKTEHFREISQMLLGMLSWLVRRQVAHLVAKGAARWRSRWPKVAPSS